MNIEKYTQNAQQAVMDCQNIAISEGHQMLDGEIFVVQFFGGLFGEIQDLADLGRGVHLAAAAGDAGQIADQCVELGE